MKLTLLVLLLSLTFMPYLALAQTTNPCSATALSGSQQASAESTLPKCVNQIYVWSLGIGSLLAFLMIIVGGYLIMTSSGNGEQASRGKEMITGAIIGIVLLFCAYLILNTINPDLTELNLRSVDQLQNPNALPSLPRGGALPGPTSCNAASC